MPALSIGQSWVNQTQTSIKKHIRTNKYTQIYATLPNKYTQMYATNTNTHKYMQHNQTHKRQVME